jgi:hypothetical protein
MVRLRVHPALLEAIGKRLQTRLVAVHTDLDALEHLFVKVVALGVGHDFISITKNTSSNAGGKSRAANVSKLLSVCDSVMAADLASRTTCGVD